MPETELLTEAQIAEVEARHELAETVLASYQAVSDSLADIPALIRDWRAMEAENERQREQYKDLDADYADEVKENAALREQLARIATFASHTDECEWWDAIPRTICTCGLSDIVEKIK